MMTLDWRGVTYDKFEILIYVGIASSGTSKLDFHNLGLLMEMKP